MTGVRLLVRDVPTSVDAEELYDALRTHHGGTGLRDALFLPAAPGQATAQAIVDYEDASFAEAAVRVDLWVDGHLCSISRMGPAPVATTAHATSHHATATVEVSGFGVATSAEEIYNALRGFVEVLCLETNNSGTVRVSVPQGDSANLLINAVRGGRVMPGLNAWLPQGAPNQALQGHAAAPVPPQAQRLPYQQQQHLPSYPGSAGGAPPSYNGGYGSANAPHTNNNHGHSGYPAPYAQQHPQQQGPPGYARAAPSGAAPPGYGQTNYAHGALRRL